MYEPLEIFRSVEVVWVIWLFSCLTLMAMTIHGVSRIDWHRFISLDRDEDGAAYALSYVMVVPLYFIFVCLVVETSLILVTKVGTVYSANAGARTAIVWETAASPSEVEQRITESARQAFVPFATGVRISGATTPAATADQRKYIETYKEHVDEPAIGDANLLTKLANAKSKLTVDYTPPTNWSDDAEVEVNYDFRFHVPVIGHALGTKADDGYRYYAIKSTVKLQNEGPQNDAQRTGISYASPD